MLKSSKEVYLKEPCTTPVSKQRDEVLAFGGAIERVGAIGRVL